MTHTRSKPLALALSLSLACSLVPTLASAQEPAADSATVAPIVVVTPAPDPAPAPAVAVVEVAPPAPNYEPTPATEPPILYVDPHVAALKQQRSLGLGMTISGFTMFGTSYLISALIGTISLDLARSLDGSGTYGRRMLIPVAGPFMAIPRADSATGGLATGMVGVIQIGGLLLGTIGAVKYSRANRELRLSADAGGLKLQF